MANDFSGDANCVALFKFENDATDSKGGNDLTAVNTPTYDSGDYKEGSYSADVEKDSTQYFAIADGDLDAGFPGKSGTSEQSFSICFWLKVESSSANATIVGKYYYSDGKRSYYVGYSSSSFIFLTIGYNSGASYTTLAFDTACTDGKWYHVGIVYDSSDNGMKIRVWDDEASGLLDSNKEGTAGGDMSPTAAPLEIGCYDNGGGGFFDGKIDEVVFFNDVLTDDEIDAIRAGTFGAPTGTTVTPTTKSLTITEYAPSIIVGTVLTPTTLSLTLTEYVPSILVSDNIEVTPTTLSLTLTEYIPPLIAGTVLTPTTLNLTLTSYAPTISISDHITVTPTTLNLILTEYAPSIIIGTVLTPTTLSQTLTTYIPSIVIGTIITPTTENLALTTYAPSLVEGTGVTPSTLSLTITTYAPTISISDNIAVTPSTLNLTLTPYAPVISVSDHIMVTPATASLTLTEYAPSIIVGTVLTPSTLSQTLTTYAPSIVIGTVITPPTLSLTLTKYAPTLQEVLTPSTLSLTLTKYAPSIIAGTVITPSTLSLILTKYAPTLIAGTVLMPTTLSLTLSTYAPSMEIDVVVVPSVLHLLLATYAPLIGQDLELTPTTASLLLTSYIPSIFLRTYPALALDYILEVHNTSGDLISYLENAFEISYDARVNSPHQLNFAIPATDSKRSDIILANEIWLRNMKTNTVVRKFRLQVTRDERNV